MDDPADCVEDQDPGKPRWKSSGVAGDADVAETVGDAGDGEGDGHEEDWKTDSEADGDLLE